MIRLPDANVPRAGNYYHGSGFSSGNGNLFQNDGYGLEFGARMGYGFGDGELWGGMDGCGSGHGDHIYPFHLLIWVRP
jgi:hypothetical protein